jgi:hypothetical protein
LSGEIGAEYIKRLETESSYEDLLELVNQTVPYLIQIHSEFEAVDLLLEVEQLHNLERFCNDTNYRRVCLYLLSASNYSADTEELKQILCVAYKVYMKFV